MKVEGSTGGEETGIEKRRSEKRELNGENGVAHQNSNGVRISRKNRGCGRRTRRRVQADSVTAIQKLFLACKSVFKGPGTVPAPSEVDMLQQILDKMRPEDLGLSTDLPFFKAESPSKETPRITYTTIYKSNNFSMVMFILPPRAVIPLHNHPGMTVFSKLLLGSMRIKSYDWADPSSSSISSQPDQLRLATLVEDSDFTAPCDTSILYPTTGGNMHTFRAITACAILDVLGPPYSIDEDRDCTYYRDFPYSHHPNGFTGITAEQIERLGWLQEIEMPKDLKIDAVEYLGPQIIDTCRKFVKI